MSDFLPTFSLKKRYQLVCISFLVILGMATACTDGGPELKVQLTKGQALAQQTEVISRVVQVYRGDSIETLMEVSTQTEFEVNDVKEDRFFLTGKHQKMEADMIARGRHFGISSEEGGTVSPLSTILANVKDKPFSLALTNQGRIDSFSGLTEWIDKAFSQLEGYTDTEIASLREQIETSFGTSIFIGNFELVSAAFPDEAVQEGDSWEIYSEMVTGFAGMAKVTYTLSEVSKSHYTIMGSGTIFSDPEGQAAISSALQLQYNLSGTIESVLKIDKKTGWVVAATVGQFLEGTVAMPSLYQDDEEMKLPMYLENQMRITGKVH